MLQRLACYARDEENKLRHDYSYFSPLIELEVLPEGLCVKAIGGDKDKAFQSRLIVAWDCMTETTCMHTINDVSDNMRKAMGGSPYNGSM
jgi:hypothetical protein